MNRIADDVNELTANMLPVFGSDECFNYIKEKISSPDFDHYYDAIAPIVKRDARERIYSKGLNKQYNLSNYDVVEIIQDVQISVRKLLMRFCRAG